MKPQGSGPKLRFLTVVLTLALLLLACGQGAENTTMPPTPTELPFAEEPNNDVDSSDVDDDSETNTSDVDIEDSDRRQPSINIIRPLDGETVPQTFEMEVAVTDFDLQPAGRSLADQGHWHVIVDDGCAEPGQAIPAGTNHFHAGDGSATRTLQLSPGPHELCVQIGDGFHIAVNIFKIINIVVR